MISRRHRVLVGRLFHESHAFSPLHTAEENFTILRGDALASATDAGSTFGGIVSKLTSLGYDLVFGLSAVAPPGGLVEHDVFTAFADEFITLAKTSGCDAIALELHGAMGTTRIADAEGELLAALRRAAGAHVVIGVGLDLHAHVTPLMLSNADICIACKENPHSDVVACGERVAELVDRMLAGAMKPVSVMTKVRMIAPGANETAFGPLAALHAEARAQTAAHREIVDVSLYNVMRYLDDTDMGQAVVVLADGEVERAEAVSLQLAEEFWRRRADFRDELLSIDEALDCVADNLRNGPYALADMGDRVLAGAPGDSTAILARAMQRKLDLKGAFVVTDPVSVQFARAAGVGQRVALRIGGRMTPNFEPLAVIAHVTSSTDGAFVMKGPYQAGEKSSLGDAVTVLIDGRWSVLLTSKPAFSHDPAAFESQGIEVAKQDFVVVKSGYHFKLNFDALATPLLVRSPGIGYYAKGCFDWQRGRFWPEHDVPDPVIGPLCFARRQAG